MGMNIDYKGVFETPLTATTTIDKNSFFTLEKYPGQVCVPVEVTDENGKVTCTASVCNFLASGAQNTELSLLLSGSTVDIREADQEGELNECDAAQLANLCFILYKCAS
jgi:hypothetical protein